MIYKSLGKKNYHFKPAKIIQIYKYLNKRFFFKFLYYLTILYSYQTV